MNTHLSHTWAAARPVLALVVAAILFGGTMGSSAQVPPNDLCSGAIVVSVPNYTNTQSTVAATSAGDPVPRCISSFGNGVWYQYTAPTNGQLTVDTLGSSFDTGLAVYVGTCGSLNEIDCSDDNGGISSSYVSLRVTAGTTYYLLAGGFNAAAGSLVLHLAFRAVQPGLVAIFSAETDANNADVRTKIAATGLFGADQVDTYSVIIASVPTLAQLRQYQAVLIYSNYRFSDATAMGNVLADYIDAGGGVVLATHSFSTDGISGLGGRIVNGGYLPFTMSAPEQSSYLALVADLPGHALMQGVSRFDGGAHSMREAGTTASGATLVAHWSDGTPLVSYLPSAGTAGKRVVGLNFWPPSSDADSYGWQAGTDGGRMMANALAWVNAASTNEPPSITIQPTNQTVAVGITATFGVRAEGTLPLSYYWMRNGSFIAGGNESSYDVVNPQLTDTGSQFSCLVSNAYGTILSSNAVLTVLPARTLGEVLDAPQLAWSTGGSASWFPQSVNTEDGVAAAQSGRIGNSQQTWLETTVTGPGTLSFWWSVSSESCCDALTFYVDGVSQVDIRGTVSWRQRTNSINAGTHTLRWTYSKDGSVSAGSDAGWVDQVAFTSTLGIVDHFAWSPIASSQNVNSAFPVVITAQDVANATVTNFAGTVAINASVAGGTTSLFSDDFEDGDYSGWVAGPGSYTRQVTTATAAGGTRSLTLIGGASEHFDGVSHSFASLTPSQIQFYVRGSRTAAAGYFVLGQGVDNSQTAVFFHLDNDGTAGVYEGTNWHSAPYLPNQWYKVNFTFDWKGRRLSYYLNDTLVQANIPFRATSVDSLTMAYLYNFDNSQAWWDEIQFLDSSPAAVPVTPTLSGSFASGLWSGNITFPQAASNAVLRADDGAGHTGSSNPFDVVGGASPIVSFTNAAAITINDALAGDTPSAATPYPSSIVLSGLVGTISHVTVTLRGLTHSYPHDVGALLVGPKGQKIVLLADCGSFAVADLTLTFDDNAPTGLSEYPAGPIVSGSYKPSNCGSGDTSFPVGAPAGPYASTLATCDGANPNGVWSLYVQDDSHGDSGTIANGWALSFNLLTPLPPPLILQQPQGQTVFSGQPATFSLTASGAQFYAWRMNGTNLSDGGRISGSATADLVMNGTLTSDSGNWFSCVVGNANGSVTSSPSLLTVLSPSTPFFGQPTFINSQFQATLYGAPTRNYTIYVSSDLVSWKPLRTVTVTSGSTNVSDASAGLQGRFYRANLAP